MNIVVGYDGSNVAKEALVLAKKHAKAFDGKVYLLNALAQSPDLQLEDIQKGLIYVYVISFRGCPEHTLEHVLEQPSEPFLRCSHLFFGPFQILFELLSY